MATAGAETRSGASGGQFSGLPAKFARFRDYPAALALFGTRSHRLLQC
jgi:hypothetical protein